MNLTQWLLIAVIVLPLIPVALNRLRIDIAALLMAVALGILQYLGFGMLGPENAPANAIKAVSGFSEPVVITLMALFILTRGLEKSGLTRWLSSVVLKMGGAHPSRLIFLLASITAALSLIMNNLAAGALVLPIAMETSRQTGIRPSKLLIPVAYGSLLGGSATYFTSANIIMSNLLTEMIPSQAPLRILDFTPTGGLIAIAGIFFLGFFGKRLLPDHPVSPVQSETRRTIDELVQLYAISERSWKARVLPHSPLINKSILESRIGAKFGITLTLISRGAKSILFPNLDCPLHSGDILHLIGREDRIIQLQELGMELSPDIPAEGKAFKDLSYLEIILAPHSNLEGLTLRDINFRQHYGASVIALKRGTRIQRTDLGITPLQKGDSLLAIGPRQRISTLRSNSDFIIIEPGIVDEKVDKKKAIHSMGLVTAAVAASIAGVPIYIAVLAAALISLLLRVIPPEEAYQSIEWQAIFLIAGMYAVSIATVQTGLAGLLGSAFIALAKPFGALGLAGSAYLLTGLLTQIVGGQVAALISGPIAISAAVTMGVNPAAVAVATGIGCSASFLTPMAHPVNLLMIAPANYRFHDFFRIGWLLTLLSFIVLMLGMHLFWGLRF